jgi:alpha-1,2-glucosyltransferase
MKVVMQYKHILILFLFTALALGMHFMISSPPLVDEKPHSQQILAFKEGGGLKPYITTVPGYHLLLSKIARFTGATSVQELRSITFFFSILAVISFMLLAIMESKSPFIKIYQFVFLPVLFPFFFLIYTDVTSLLLVMTSLFLVLRRKYHWGGFAAILSMLIRQNNIAWIAFFILLIAAEKYSFKTDKKSILGLIWDGWVLLLGMVGFLVYVFINEGVALGDVEAHPSFTFRVGNIFSFLATFFVLFLPLNLWNAPRIWKLLKEKKIWVMLAIALGTFLLMFINDHPYNIDWEEYFIRNWVLITFTSTLGLKLLFFTAAAYGALSLAVTPLLRRSAYLIYPCTFLYLLPSWLIEQRYYIIPLTLFILFKKEGPRWLEITTILLFIVISASLLQGFKAESLFL